VGQQEEARGSVNDWPDADLEHLGRCPSCGSSARALRLENLEDRAFKVAGGRWNLFDCRGCGSAYLDPRPSVSSIGRAYERYYTQADHVAEPDYFWNRADWRSRLMTGYLNSRYGYAFPKGLKIGGAIVPRWRRLRLDVDYAIAHLPAPSHPGAKLLDVGCGNGGFVALAGALGYKAVGLDPDPIAVAAGTSRGLDIRLGILPDPAFAETGFDQIIMSHVFEHFHSPREALMQTLGLLGPGGRVWISQPNLEAAGLEKFQESWRGLEAPRHLTLHNFSSMAGMLREVGFAQIRLQEPEEAAEFYFLESHRMALGAGPNELPEVDSAIMASAQEANRSARSHHSRSESLTITAVRPCSP
jgi:SAM-dependent methyltransferase